MGRNTSVSLGDYFETFVDKRVIEGRFKNASEAAKAGDVVMVNAGTYSEGTASGSSPQGRFRAEC